MKFVVEGYVQEGEELVNPCGSDYCAIISDLKSLNGVIKRIRNWKFPNDVVEVRVYSAHNVQDRGSYNLLYRFNPVHDKL